MTLLLRLIIIMHNIVAYMLGYIFGNILLCFKHSISITELLKAETVIVTIIS